MKIRSRFHDYSVTAAPSLRAAIASAVTARKPFLFVDREVRKRYPESFHPGVPILEITASEEQKSYDQISPLFQKLIAAGFRKDHTLIVIGGGVTQDIGCFISSVFFRGIQWKFIPTTLLAQCDSCIGSKSSINIGIYKNQLGTFYPPHEIWICTEVLKTLSETDIRSGLGEMIKLALIAGEGEFQKFVSDMSAIQAQPALMNEWILNSLKIKQKYIEEDELDRGIRNILNYGHTFGHAYESATDFKIPHGIAVLLGILAATYISERLQMVNSGYFESLKSNLKSLYEPFEKTLFKADPEKIFSAIKTDKKNTSTDIICILTRGAGKMEKTALPFEQIQTHLNGFLSESL